MLKIVAFSMYFGCGLSFAGCTAGGIDNDQLRADIGSLLDARKSLRTMARAQQDSSVALGISTSASDVHTSAYMLWQLVNLRKKMRNKDDMREVDALISGNTAHFNQQIIDEAEYETPAHGRRIKV